MPAIRRIAVFLALMAVSSCQQYAGYQPIPGPSPDAEVVAVSKTIASAASPVFYYRDPQDNNRLLAYDWSGALRGSLTVAAGEPYGVTPSTDGTMLLLTHGHIASGGTVVGRVASGIWAGDNAHICAFLNTLGGPGQPRTRQMSPNEFETISTPAALYYESVSGKSRRVINYGQFGPHGGPVVLACNAASDRAIIGGSFVANLSALTMIRLSDGKVVTQSLGGPHRGADGTMVSADGTLIAQGSTGGISMGAASDGFTVFRLPGNQVVAEVVGSGIEAFSADGSRALTAEDVGGSNEHQRYQLVDLASSKTLWSAVFSPGTVRPRPGTGDFLVASRSFVFNPSRPHDPATVNEDAWLISADGSSKLLLKQASPLE